MMIFQKKNWPHCDVCSVVLMYSGIGQVLYYNCLGRYNISRQLLAGVNSKNF